MVSPEEFCNFCSKRFSDTSTYTYFHYKTVCHVCDGNLIKVKYDLSLRIRTLKNKLAIHQNDAFYGLFLREFNADLDLFNFLAEGPNEECI